jgi:WD40 repeat protein
VAPATVSSALADVTVRAALGTASARVAALSGSALPGLAVLRGKIVFICLLLLGVATGSVMALLPRTSPPVRAAAASAAQSPTAPPPADEPLPQGALARLGTTRFRHSFGVWVIAYSRDGKLLASGGNGRWLCLWDARTGRLLHHWKGQSHPTVFALAFSPDGRILAASDGKLIKLWSVETHKELREFTGHDELVSSLAFSPDGKVLASAGRDATVRLWDATTGRQLNVLKGHTGMVNALAYRDDGKVLASAGSDGSVRLWDPRMGTPLHVCMGHDKDVFAVAFQPKSKRVVSSGLVGDVRVWHGDTGKQERILSREDGIVCALAFAPDGKTVAVGRKDTVVLHDIASGTELRRWRLDIARGFPLAWSPDGKTLATGGYGTIRQWDPTTGKEHKGAEEGHVSPIHHLQFDKDTGRLTSIGWDGRSLEWDLTTGKNRLLASAWPSSYDVPVFAITYNRKFLATSSGIPGEPVIDLYDRTAKKKLHALAGHTDAVMALDFAPDGRRLFSLGRDRTVRAWDVGTGAQHWQANVGANQKGPYVRSLAVAPDGKGVACALDSIIHLLDAATGKELRTYPYGQHVFSLAWSPDGSRIVLVGGMPIATGGVYLGVWDARTGERIRYWKSPQSGSGNQVPIAISPDSRFLATGSDSQGTSVYVWELATGGKIAVLEGHHSGVWKLAFSADGRTLASGGGDSSILLWDMTRRMHDGKLAPVAISAARFAQLWRRLADTDAAVGHAALWELVAGGRAVLPLLKARMPVAATLDARQAAKLIERLDADDYETREKAMKETAKLGLAAEVPLLKALAGRPGLEPRRRVEALVDGWLSSPDWLRYQRAVAVLEHNGSAEAKEVLTALARGAEGARSTKEAAAALARLRGRR